jgi:hypothetical protein
LHRNFCRFGAIAKSDANSNGIADANSHANAESSAAV